jgi:hypothetical protein
MSTEIIVNNDIIEINVTEEIIIIEAPSGAYPLPSGVYSVFGRTGNVIAQDGDYNLTQLGDVTITNASTGQVLRYDGTAWVNSTESYVGTVTSVAASVPTGLTISGSPITTAGTLEFGLDTGYVIPLQSTLDAKALKATTISTTAPLTGGGDLSANRTFAIAKSTTSVDGYLAATDFTTFNNKQNALSGSGIVKSTSGVITYLTDNTANWDTAYNRSLTSAAVTGTTTKTLTLNEQGGGTITASWTDINTDAVSSVFGRTGAVVAQSGDYTTTQVTEGTNLYFTDARARGAVSFTAGSGAYNSTTGVFTIPTNTNQLTNGAAYITLTSLSASAPLSYSNTTGAFSISQANTSTDGYLSSFDWNTFNSKQIALTLGNLTSSDITVTGGTGAVVGSGSTLTLATVNTNVGGYGDSTHVPTITVNAKGLVTAASQTAIPTATNSVTGLLTYADWSTFNGKQNQLNGTGFVKASGTTITYDNSTYLTTIEGITAGGELSGTYASPFLVNSAVTGKVLTGVNITGGTIVSTDSILTAFGKVQNQINGLIGGSLYKGTWNANTNTPALTSGVGTAGWYYIVSVAGTTNLDGITDWQVGDWAIFQGSVWQKVDNTDAVVSVNGFTGAVSLTTSNITEGTNLYYTDARARLSNSAGTGISYNSTSGVITNSAPDQTVSLTGAGTTSISGTYPSFTITSNDTYNGTVTSIGITESVAALSITGSPVTTSGNINIGFAGTSSQYVAGDGSLVTFPSIISQASNLVTEVYNETGATLTKGTIVYINGGHGNLPTVAKALATADSTSAQTYGFINTDLTNNNNGFVTVIGNLENMDTQAYANGTQLYLSGTTAGTYTSTKPQAPIHLVYVAVVVRSHPTQGVLEVRIQNGYELDELHDVQITSVANGNILQYSSADSLWHNVAGSTTNIAEGTNLYYTDTRARASISTTATGLTYTSGTGVLSLTSGYVIPTTTSATNWDTAYTNRITSATTPLSIASNAISIAQSTTTTSGYLSSTDWNTFNGKSPAAGSTSITTLGTIVTGTWNATVIGAVYGGTGQSSYAIGDILYASTTTALSKLADVATGNALISGGVGIAPSWGKIALTTHVSGILPVANGGTGSATQNFVDLTTTQSIAGAKTFTSTLNVSNSRLNLLGNSSDSKAVMIFGDATYPTGSIIAPNAGGTLLIAGQSGTGMTIGTTGSATFISNITMGGNTLISTGATGFTLKTTTIGAWAALYGDTGGLFLGTNAGNWMFINNSGSVGIGTTSPSRNLHVSSSASETTIAATRAGTDSAQIGVDSAAYIACGGDFTFRTGGFASGNEKMRITAAGAATFTSSVTATGNLETTAGSVKIGIAAGGNYQLYVPASNNFTLYNSNVGNIGSFNYTTGVYTASSDINKKKDFELSTLGLDAILGLKSTLYRMKADKDNCEKHLGFIAQEVKEFIPQAYVEDGENEDKFIGLDYQAITSVLVKAIQEQNQTITSLQDRIYKLENK